MSRSTSRWVAFCLPSEAANSVAACRPHRVRGEENPNAREKHKAERVLRGIKGQALNEVYYSEKNQFSGWLSPIEIDEATDPIGADPDPGDRRASCKGVLTMPATRYFELLDWCGREIRSDKRGAIAADLAPLLGRLGIDSGGLLKAVLATGSKLGPSFQAATVATNPLTRPIDTKVGVL